MTYQIPQQLEYKEKIMFGLTFQQLAYALLFGVISLIIFRKVDNFSWKIILMLICSTLGIGFMFLNLGRLIMDYWFFWRFRNLKFGQAKLERFIGIKGMEKGHIITSSNKKVAVLRVQPINFSIKPENEKEAIMYSFQKFLNSLDFPTQILMNSEGLELNDYLASLKKRISNSSFREIFEDYEKNIRSVITDNKILNRVFYIVIPEQTNIDIQTEICINRLGNLNLKVQRVEGNRLKLLLLSYFYNSVKGIDLSKVISPESIENSPNCLKIGDKYHRIIYAHGYPRNVEAGFLDKIVSALADFNLSIHIKPYPIERMLIDLNKELQKQQADIFSMSKKGMVSPSLDIQYRDTKQTLEDLQKGKDRLFNISLYISCKADSLEDLDKLSKKVESELNSIMILPKTAQLRMLQGFKSTLPLGIDELKANRNITTEALSAFFPFTSQFLEADETGVWLGLNGNGIPIIKDIFKLPNPNGLVLAQSGGGKSFFCKLLIMRYLLNGTKVIVIDPQGEYRKLVEYFGGQRVDLSRDSNTMINPLDLMGHEYSEKRLTLIDLMQVMLGELSEGQKSFLDEAIGESYESRGINDDPESWAREPPILEDLLEILKEKEKTAVSFEKSSLRSLINRLNMYVNGVFSFLNKKTNIDFNNNFVCFDIGNLPKQVKPVIMFLVLDYVYMKMKADLSRKLLLIDESWSLLSRTEEAGYIFEIVKTCRKFNMGLLMINQEVEGLFNSPAGKSALANSAYTLLMRQKPAVIKNICDTFNLSNAEKQHLLTCAVGEGLLIMEDDHSKIKVVASEDEKKIITTNADDLNKDKIKPEPKIYKFASGKIIDKSKRVYAESELDKPAINYLIGQGFKEFKQKNIHDKKENYLIKPVKKESANHMILVYEIEKLLKKYFKKVETYRTLKADLICSNDKNKYAFEIETGKIGTNRKAITEKIALLKKEFGDNWFFVVTNRNLKKVYSNLGKTFDKRNVLSQIIKLSKK